MYRSSVVCLFVALLSLDTHAQRPSRPVTTPVGIETVSFCDSALLKQDWSSSATVGFIAHLLANEQLDPSVEGAVVSVAGSFDVRIPEKHGGAAPAPIEVGLLLVQDGATFMGPPAKVTSASWMHVDHPSLAATAFRNIGATGAKHPDFACGAKPIRAGYVTLTDKPGAVVDNWCVTFTTKCCSVRKKVVTERRLSKDGYVTVGRSCCPKPLPLDAKGEPMLPEGAEQETAVAESVNTVTGAVKDLYPGADTSLDLWYADRPCESNIGGTIPAEAKTVDLTAELKALGIDAPPDEIVKTIDAVQTGIADRIAESEPIRFPKMDPIAGPYTKPVTPHRPDPNHKYVFQGRDIVFVHGLKLEHIKSKLNGASPNHKRAQAVWLPAPVTSDASATNPAFYSGYFKERAVETWDGHVQRFLTERGLRNRYLIVSYNCSQRMETAAASVLRQVADAMIFGTGVVDPLHPNGPPPKDFGTPSMVFIVHSTGAPVTDIALTAAMKHANLKVAFIPKQTKAVIAVGGVFSGSRFAAGALVGSGMVDLAIAPSWSCPMAGMILSQLAPGEPLPECPLPNLDVMSSSILVDLVPLVMQNKWGPYIRDVPVRVLTVAQAHPSLNHTVKRLLLSGYDDGVSNINSQIASPNGAQFWPSGTRVHPAKLFEAFDIGVAFPDGTVSINIWPVQFELVSNMLNQQLRAIGYFHDQAVDRIFNPGSFAAQPEALIASTPIPWLSPTGMRQPVSHDYSDGSTNEATGIVSGFNPLRRSPNHFSFLLSASDHYKGTHDNHGGWGDGNGRDYANTPFEYAPGEWNREETRVLTHPAVYQPFAMAYPGDDAPLLRQQNTPQVNEIVRGIRLRYRVKIGRFRTRWAESWVLQRQYYLLQGWETKTQFDYVYESVLKN